MSLLYYVAFECEYSTKRCDDKAVSYQEGWTLSSYTLSWLLVVPGYYVIGYEVRNKALMI